MKKIVFLFIALIAMSCSSNHDDKRMLTEIIGQGYYDYADPDDILRIAIFAGEEHTTISVHRASTGYRHYRVTVDSVGLENCKAFFYSLN